MPKAGKLFADILHFLTKLHATEDCNFHMYGGPAGVARNVVSTRPWG